jgi:hypothetical protein
MNHKYNILFGILSTISAFNIKNQYSPLCKTCKHFIPHNSYNLESSIKFGKCGFFGEKNVLTGKIDYEYASIARKNTDCGVNGTLHLYDTNYKWKYKDTYIQPFLTTSPFWILIIVYWYICNKN